MRGTRNQLHRTGTEHATTAHKNKCNPKPETLNPKKEPSSAHASNCSCTDPRSSTSLDFAEVTLGLNVKPEDVNSGNGEEQEAAAQAAQAEHSTLNPKP